MKVTSAEFQRGFGRYRVLAQREPVVITNHGRDDLVLLTADDYARLQRGAPGPPEVREGPAAEASMVSPHRRAGSTDIDVPTRTAITTFIDQIVRSYDVVRFVLFGSRARRTHRSDSDADVAVVLRGRAGDFLETKLTMADIAYDVLLETGVLIQPLPIWEAQWQDPDQHPNPHLLRNIQREGISL